jgi:hypothetical protein
MSNPCLASSRAVARPTPADAPVTTATGGLVPWPVPECSVSVLRCIVSIAFTSLDPVL